MHKKLTKYIKNYDLVQNSKIYELKPNGGMIVLINKDTNIDIIIQNETFVIKPFQSILINAYEDSVDIKSLEDLDIAVVRFRGAGASFFYEEYLEELMYTPNEPIFLEENILNDQLDSYFQNRFKPSKLPFNIMKVIELLDIQKAGFNIDEVLAIANVPRKILDKLFRLRVGLSFKSYASIKEKENLE